MHDQEPSPGEPAAADVSAWRDLCRRLADLGELLAGPDFPASPRDRAEGFRHLAEQVVCWLSWSVSHADPHRPAFQRMNDLVTKWGGPNVENVYRHARVDPARRYRIRGRMHGCEEFILAVRAGFMHQERWGTLLEVTATDLGIEPGAEIDLVLGPVAAIGDGPRAVPLPDGAAMVSIREYYFDWRPIEPAVFTIECLDPSPDDQVAGPEALAARLDDAIRAIERSITYWNRYLVEHREAHPPNDFAPPMQVAKGLDAARYAFCFYDLGPDEALVVESPEPDARYWGLQLASLAWFESLDLAGRTTSLNHRQARVDRDGMVRVVVAHRDPGVPNWLDTEGRPAGLLTFRWFWSDEPVPPSTRVVPVDDVRTLLPPDTPAIDAAGRRAQVASRREHIAWRFRT